MEPLPSVHPLRATAGEQQNLLNRETSIVEVARTDDVGRAPNDEKPHLHPPGFSDDRGAGRASTDVARATPAPAIAHVSASTTTSPPSLQTSFRQGNHSPTQSEIDAHPIRQRLSVHGDCVVASGYGVRRDSESEQSPGIGRRQDETAIAGREHLAATDTMTDIKEGDKVAWNWGSGAPGGTAAEVVTDGEAKITSHRGNEIKKIGEPENPAVHIERPGNDVVKKASELEVEEEGPKHGGGAGEKKEEAGEAKKDEGGEAEKKDEGHEKTNGEAAAKTGEKRSADEANKDEEEKKDDNAAKANGEAAEPPKKKGRPAKNGDGAAKKETKKKEPKPAATADGKPRRSGRNRG